MGSKTDVKTDVQNAATAHQPTEPVMHRKSATIISDSARAPASSQAGDWHDEARQHRYYGSSACNGGERIVETRGVPTRAASTDSGSDRAAA